MLQYKLACHKSILVDIKLTFFSVYVTNHLIQFITLQEEENQNNSRRSFLISINSPAQLRLQSFAPPFWFDQYHQSLQRIFYYILSERAAKTASVFTSFSLYDVIDRRSERPSRDLKVRAFHSFIRPEVTYLLFTGV